MQVDYEQLADHFEASRTLRQDTARLWSDVLGEYLQLNSGSRVLDIGCGTGRFAIVLARDYRCRVLGLDPSPAMLARARSKCPGQVHWLLGRAEELPLAGGAFDVCLASQVLHHFEDRPRAFCEIARVLRPGGRLGIRYVSHAQLSSFLDYRFFPSALSIDLARVPDPVTLSNMLRAAGFGRVQEYTVRQQFCTSADDYLIKLQHQYSSVLTLIPRYEYLQGMEQAGQYLAQHGLPPDEQYAELSLVVGIK